MGAAFLVGLVGSLHCVGMCGPIALALPYQGQGGWRRWPAVRNVLLYNAGRALTYGALGMLIGLLSRGIFFAGLQKYAAIALGFGLLLIALLSIDVEAGLFRLGVYRRSQRWVRGQLGRWVRYSTPGAMLTIGMLNGLLPCGLVYLAIAGALLMGDALGGMGYMLAFGLGTFPLMLGAALGGQLLPARWRRQARRLAPALLLFFAFLFLLRGFQFQLPAPFQLWEDWARMPMCH
jgi:sulfite exporter TauE/SafE